jgi:hypothetical protein
VKAATRHPFGLLCCPLTYPLHIAQKFEALLKMYRHPDGHEWTCAKLDDATGGVVTRSHATNPRKGRIENPGYEKMRAFAKAMVSRRRCGSRMAWARDDPSERPNSYSTHSGE